MEKNASMIYSLLESNYPAAKTALEFSSPLQMMVSTILSAQCTDVRVNIVTKSLFKKYKSVSNFAKAKNSELEKDIRSTGYYRAKARHIIAACKKIISDYNGKVPSSMEELITLPGVGRKTANIILWNSFGKVDGIAVDTHVIRLSYRLGLTRSIVQHKIEQDLMSLFSIEKWPHISNLLIEHGRKICQAKKPSCKSCFFFNLCPKKEVDSKFYS